MKEREIYANIRALSPFIVRLDGRAFHRFTDLQHFKRPFDERLAEGMAYVTENLIKDSGLSPLFGYTFSDEINLFFPDTPYDGRVEKIDSVLASFASSALTIFFNLKTPVAFDSRIIPVSREHIIPYLVSRQKEAWRNHINGWSQALLIKEGFDAGIVAEKLDRAKSADLHELCFKKGINLALTPAWQRRGIIVYRKEIRKEGFNPIIKEKTWTVRRVITIDRDIPLFSKPEGVFFINRLLSEEISD